MFDFLVCLVIEWHVVENLFPFSACQVPVMFVWVKVTPLAVEFVAQMLLWSKHIKPSFGFLSVSCVVETGNSA